MRKITKDAVRHFINDVPFKRSNTEVTTDGYGVELKLFGNIIARKSNRCVYVTMAGWNTRTTIERLNGLLSQITFDSFVSNQKGDLRFNFMFDSIRWDGDWKLVRTF